jgi:hypothetical protein
MRVQYDVSELWWVGLCPNHHSFGFPPLSCYSYRILPDRPRPASATAAATRAERSGARGSSLP